MKKNKDIKKDLPLGKPLLFKSLILSLDKQYQL